MRAEELRNEIYKLKTSEKMMLLEDVWNEIAKSNEQLPLAEWQKQELDKRLHEYDCGAVQTKDWNQVHEGLRKKYK